MGQKGSFDYTGVPTAQLSKLMRDRGINHPEEWSSIHGFPKRTIARIYYCESQWTNLDMADRICLALGRASFLQLLTVIPAGYGNSARKMAEDEFYAKEIEPTPTQLEKRAKELRTLRNQYIKDQPRRKPSQTGRKRTPEQIEVNRRKQKERDQRKLKRK